MYGAGRSRITHPFATLTTKQSPMDPVRLACVKHAASVHPEPESNPPQKKITKRSKRTIEFDSKSTAKQRHKKPLFCSRPLSSSQATTHRHADQTGTRPARRHDGHRIAPGKSLGWRSGSPKAHPHHPGTHRTTGGAKPTTSSTPATRPHATTAREGSHRTPNGILHSP